MLKFQPHLGPQYWFKGDDFNKLESKSLENDCIVISQRLRSCEKDF